MAVQTITEYQMFIAGEWASASGGEWVDVRNPASGEVIARVPSATRADVDRAVAAARAAFRDSRWRGLWIPERVAILNRLADLIFEEYTQVKHVMVELNGEAEKGWHYTVVGDPQP